MKSLYLPRFLKTSRTRQRSNRKGSRIVWGPERLERRALLSADIWQNVASPEDVNADGLVSPLDALLVINQLNAAQDARSAGAAAKPMYYYDVNGDSYITPIDALLVLNTLNGEGENHDLARIRLLVTDTEGNPIDQIDPGQSFQLRGLVQDLTGRAEGGVFAAYLDVEYDSALVSVAGPIQHSPTYGNAPSPKPDDPQQPGLIDEVGSFDGLTPLGPDELLLFTVPFQADSQGLVTFSGNPADIRPAHDVLLFGVVEELGGTAIVPPDRVDFVSATLQIGEVISAPVARDDAYTVDADTTLQVDAAAGVLANDTGPDGVTLMATLVNDVANGTLVLNSDGSFNYAPTSGFTGSDTFTYIAVANGQNSNEATVTITVRPVNQPPAAQDDAYTTNEDSDLIVPAPGVLANDSDPDGDTITAQVVTNPASGTLALNADGSFTYRPNLNFNGSDIFSYTVSDGRAESAAAVARITVNPVNDPPVAQPDSYTTRSGQQLNVPAANGVLANDSDPDGDSLTASVVTPPQNGTLTLNANGSFVYGPAADFAGTDTFTYRANDQSASSTPTTVTIIVSPSEAVVRIRLETVNQFGAVIDTIAPGGSFQLRGFVEDVSALPRDGIFAAYMDVLYPQNRVTVSGDVVFGTSYPNGQVANLGTPGILDEIGAFDGLTPLGAGEQLLFTVPFTATSEGSAVFTSEPADVLPAHDILVFLQSTPVPADTVEYGSTTLTIRTGNPPVADDDFYVTNEDLPLEVAAIDGVLANDTDPDGDQLSAFVVTAPQNGELSLSPDGSFTYTPSSDFNGTDTFTYRANDGLADSNTATVTITVRPIDDPPVAIDDTYMMDDNTTLVVDAADGVLANDRDDEGETLTAQLVTGPSSGTLTLNSDGSFTYTPNRDFIGRDTFTYLAVGDGLQSNVATVTIDVGDLTPSSISGFVYFDTDNDGIKDPNELVYGGVEVRLTGSDIFGQSVSMMMRTDADGAYSFGDLLRGRYTVSEVQPIMTVDGKDTHNGQASEHDDRFEILLGPGVEGTNYNFGERGVHPQFISLTMFFASARPEAVMVALDSAGNQAWFCSGPGWQHLTDIQVQLNSNRSALTLTAADATGNVSSNVVQVTGNRQVRVQSSAGEGTIVRLTGSAQDFGLPAAGAAASPLSAAAIDAVFGGR